jgi:hypothetical protein
MSKAEEKDIWTIQGAVSELGKPRAEISVEAFDRDLSKRQPLGRPATTGKDGSYRIEFTTADFAQGDRKTRPTPWLVVRASEPEGGGAALAPWKLTPAKPATPPVPAHVEVIMRLREVITEQKALLEAAVRSLDDQALRSLGASEGQIRNLANQNTYAAAYGQLLEGLVERAVAADPLLNSMIEFTGDRVTMNRVDATGKVVNGKPDFTGRPNTPMQGYLLDLTTTRDAIPHYERFYGENMVVFTADAPMPTWLMIFQ